MRGEEQSFHGGENPNAESAFEHDNLTATVACGQRMSYFSETVRGERPRDREKIDEAVWAAIPALLKARIEDGSFGASYPEKCQDGGGPFGTDATSGNSNGPQRYRLISIKTVIF